MSRYTLNIKNRLGFESEIKEITNMLNKNDYISIHTDENISKESIAKVIEEQNLEYNYINQNCILVKK